MLPFRAYQFFIFFLALSALMKVLIKRCTIIKNPFHVSISFESKKAPQNGRSIPFFVCDNCTFSTWHFCNSYDMLYFQQKICNQALSNGEDGLACNEKEREKGLFDFPCNIIRDFKIVKYRAFFCIIFQNNLQKLPLCLQR